MSKIQSDGSSRVEKYARIIERNNKRLALGYEATLDFNHGYIFCLRQAKILTQKEANMLQKVYANSQNGEYRFVIIKGRIVDQNKSNEQQIEDFYEGKMNAH